MDLGLPKYQKWDCANYELSSGHFIVPYIYEIDPYHPHFFAKSTPSLAPDYIATGEEYTYSINYGIGKKKGVKESELIPLEGFKPATPTVTRVKEEVITKPLKGKKRTRSKPAQKKKVVVVAKAKAPTSVTGSRLTRGQLNRKLAEKKELVDPTNELEVSKAEPELAEALELIEPHPRRVELETEEKNAEDIDQSPAELLSNPEEIPVTDPTAVLAGKPVQASIKLESASPKKPRATKNKKKSSGKKSTTPTASIKIEASEKSGNVVSFPGYRRT